MCVCVCVPNLCLVLAFASSCQLFLACRSRNAVAQDLKDVAEEDRDAVSKDFVDRMQTIQSQLEHIAPNMRAVERCVSSLDLYS